MERLDAWCLPKRARAVAHAFYTLHLQRVKRTSPVKSVHIGIRAEPEIIEAIDALRESRHEPRSSVIRRVVMAAARRRAKGGAGR